MSHGKEPRETTWAPGWIREQQQRSGAAEERGPAGVQERRRVCFSELHRLRSQIA